MTTDNVLQEINHPSVLKELTEAFELYEHALINNDVAALDAFFWDSEHTIRFGATENLYGFKEIQDFRKNRLAHGLDRTITRKVITTFGLNFGTASIEFRRPHLTKIGRQMQTWVKLNGAWCVVAAQISFIDG